MSGQRSQRQLARKKRKHAERNRKEAARRESRSRTATKEIKAERTKEIKAERDRLVAQLRAMKDAERQIMVKCDRVAGRLRAIKDAKVYFIPGDERFLTDMQNRANSWEGWQVEFMPLLVQNCHANVAVLSGEGLCRWATGWAWNDMYDRWVSHSGETFPRRTRSSRRPRRVPGRTTAIGLAGRYHVEPRTEYTFRDRRGTDYDNSAGKRTAWQSGVQHRWPPTGG